MSRKVSAEHLRAKAEYFRIRAAGEKPNMTQLARKHKLNVSTLLMADWYKADIAARKQAAQPGEER